MIDIIVVHGALGAAAQMQPVAKALRALGNVVVAELPGHGATTLGDATFSMATFVRSLAETVAAISYVETNRDAAAPKPVVFGYSMGGYVALTLEAKRPGTFSGIVTLGTKFEWTPTVAAQESARLDHGAISEKLPKFAATLSDRHTACGGWHDVLANTRLLLESLGSAPLLTRESLSHIAVPVCVAVGDRDETVSAAEAEKFAGYMRNGVSRVLADTPHPIERVSPDTVLRLVHDVSVASVL
jgi:pimeloyl-ACP methyl ester carboxylesterase